MIEARITLAAAILLIGSLVQASDRLQWQSLPALPDSIGVAGPFVGVHNDALIVAGGANFALPDAVDLWDVPKVWHDDAYVLMRTGKNEYEWATGYQLDRPIGYGACVSTGRGVVCIGGDDGKQVFADVFLMTWEAHTRQLGQRQLPSLPEPCTNGAAALIGDVVYVAGGQTSPALDSATNRLVRLNLAATDATWEQLPPWPGPERAFPLVAAQHNGFNDCIYVIGGRRQDPNIGGDAGVIALADVYEFSPARHKADPATAWRQLSNAPQPIMAGTAAPVGQSHIYTLTGADGELMKRIAAEPEFVKSHPGFPRRAYAYHTITDTWVDAGETPANPVTTPAVVWDGAIVIASGEIRPRVRTNAVWRIKPTAHTQAFGPINLTVLVVYLMAMVGVGVYFMNKNKNTDDYFRGGQQMAWWAAGCSIFATMLSSITFMAIPAKAYAQDWVYLVGNMMILGVAPIAVYMALPFFRRIDATSAYEYLEKRFNRPVRLFASALFTLFHVFRMAIVMSLAGLALAVVTPMSASQCVIIMGVLSILYCTLGGVEAVIWTDTIQTVVLLGGAVLCLVLMIAGTGGDLGHLWNTAADAGKLHSFNFHLDATSANLALWVVIFGAIGQNFSSYTADQAVVQRYMTTPDERRAARSIWFAAGLAIPASFLFYGLGTGLFVFYGAHPEKLDPTFTTDQIFPLFILNETPVGIAGLIVAGVFAAAQSTVSTSMNSTATAVVTDFLRPFKACKSERGYLNAARALTLAFGIAGTLIGLVFVDPNIKSLFDEFLKVIGLFMGVLGGLFALGMLTRRANGPGALVGVVAGAGVMFALPLLTEINGYLYAAIGIACCFAIGYIVSVFIPTVPRDLEGLTLARRSQSIGEGD